MRLVAAIVAGGVGLAALLMGLGGAFVLSASQNRVAAGGNQPSAFALSDIPPGYLVLYEGAAQTCPGLSWAVLAGIGKIETNHGRSTLPGVQSGTNSAGAAGPMQFLAATFAAYEVDGDHDGKFSIYDPADAIYTAAHYLCSNGAGHPASLSAAIFVYNHLWSYVQSVLATSAQYVAGGMAAVLGQAATGGGGSHITGGVGIAPLFPWVPAGGFPNSTYPPGQCTWWAAYNHQVPPFLGNGGQWITNARAQGLPTAPTPSVGAVTSWLPGPAYSAYGHVGLVIAVSANSYEVSEMNYTGANQIDTRTIAWPDPNSAGFIP